MTGTPGFTEFFVLEAGEYIEQIDGLLLAAGASAPNTEELQRLARALRGSATMAKLTAFAGVAAAMERVGRALREGELRWEPTLEGALVATVDDLRTLLRSARSWSSDDDLRAGARVAELNVYAPPRTSGAFRPVGDRSAGVTSAYLGNEAANIAAGLELVATRPGDAPTAGNVLGRIRALRGVAQVKEVGALASVLEATEDAAHGLEAGTPMSPEVRRVLLAAIGYLRALTPALRGISIGDRDVDAPGTARDEFSAAVAAWRARAGDAERIVPISELFYRDGSPSVIETSAHPPTSAHARFHLEMVSLAEHLHAVVDSGRRALEPDAVERARREAIRAVRALKASAESFAEHDTAARITDHLGAAERSSREDLEALAELASSLTSPLGGYQRPGSTFFTPAAQAPAAAEVPPATEPHPAPPAVTVADSASAALLDSTIAALDQLTVAPMISPTPIPEDVIVPIETLLYRGRAALDRAVVVRDELRREAPPFDSVALEASSISSSWPEPSKRRDVRLARRCRHRDQRGVSVFRLSQCRIRECRRERATCQLLAPAPGRGVLHRHVSAARAPVANHSRPGGTASPVRRSLALDGNRNDGEQRRAAARRRICAGIRADPRGSRGHLFDGVGVVGRGPPVRRDRRPAFAGGGDARAGISGRSHRVRTADRARRRRVRRRPARTAASAVFVGVLS